MGEQELLETGPQVGGHGLVPVGRVGLGAVDVERAVAGEDDPRRAAAVDGGEVLLEEGVLGGARGEGVLSGRHQEVHRPEVQAVPGLVVRLQRRAGGGHREPHGGGDAALAAGVGAGEGGPGVGGVALVVAL